MRPAPRRDRRDAAPARTPARARARRRARERGAVVFIVATTLALLATVGVYALTQARTEVRAAGYLRQATQAHYVTELAGAAVSEHVTSANADYFLNVLMTSDKQDKNCLSAAKWEAAKTTSSALAQACWRFDLRELQPTWSGKTAFTTESFGRSEVGAGFFVEMTNPMTVAMPPGFDLSLGLGYARVTVTAGGYVYPLDSANPALVRSETLELGRGRFLVGPIRK